MPLANEQCAAPSSNDGGDIHRGTESIGGALGLSPRAAYDLISAGELKSVRRIGGRYWASKSRLIAEVTGSD